MIKRVNLLFFIQYFNDKSRRSQMFFKIGVHKTLLKRDSSTAVFLWILRNFYEQLFYRTSWADASVMTN